jgi:DNA-binding NarL/FixJ family response regulator
MRKLRIVLADDHVILRDGVALLLNAQSDMEVVGQACDGRAVIQQTLECQPNIVVVDISMPSMSGTQAVEELRRACPDAQVVVLTRHSEQGYVRQLLQAGARGYVLKQSGAEELITALRAVAAGSTHLDTSLAHRVVDDFVRTRTQASELREPDLSERETDVVRLTAHGYSNKEIAAQLGLSIKTVDTYKARAMEKLGLYSRAAFVRYALQRGWFDQSG